MKVLVALPTKSINDPLIALGEDYLKRLRPPMSARALFINPKVSASQENVRKDIEGKELLSKTEGHVRIALAEHGKMVSSNDFAKLLARYQQHTSKIAFLIGGAYGHAPSVIAQSDATLSLSPMTMPHRMAFLILAEQLYRAGEIIFGSPYHK